MHAICHYFGQWLPADDRGFRAVDHKIHSSGDYKNPPPVHEHEGLRNWIKSHMGGDPVFLEPPEYPVLGSAFIHKLNKIGGVVRCLCCGATHIHVMYDSVASEAKDEIGRAKQFASLKLESHPGRVFAKDCSVEEVEGIGHARELWKYILKHEFKEGAWV
jgi:hypothetical protein